MDDPVLVDNIYILSQGVIIAGALLTIYILWRALRLPELDDRNDHSPGEGV